MQPNRCSTACIRGLTFELSGRHRQGAWAASPMISTTGSRPKRLAGGGPLERRVRRHRTPPQLQERTTHYDEPVVLLFDD